MPADKPSKSESLKSMRGQMYKDGWDGRSRTPRHLPATINDCPGPGNPCPYVSCRYHLFLDVAASGSIQYNYPNLESPLDLKRPCALDYAMSPKELTLEEVGEILGGVTRERIRQIVVDASTKVRKRMRGVEREFIDHDPAAEMPILKGDT